MSYKELENIIEDNKEIIEKINSNGGKIYLVGGAVRDILLNKKIKDLDFCICNMERKTFENLFPLAKVIGKAFPVYTYKGMEFAFARKEKSIGKSHKDFSFDIDSSISIEEDLKRRDITINSIAINLKTKKVVDPYGGIEDLNKKIIRNTSKAFVEDPNRVYRVARFASEYNFMVSDETMDLIANMKESLNLVPVEVLFKELNKALKSKNPSVFFKILKEANVLDVHFKEVSDLIGVIQPLKYHPEGDVFNHTMKVVDLVAKENVSQEIVFAALTHDFGKALTKKEELPHHIDHDKNGVILVSNFCNRLKVPNRYKKIAKYVCLNHMRFARYNEMKFAKKIDMLESIEKSNITLEEMEIIINADNSMIPREKILFAKEGKEILNKINGAYINEKYPNIYYGEKFKQKLREERINYIKKLYKF